MKCVRIGVLAASLVVSGQALAEEAAKPSRAMPADALVRSSGIEPDPANLAAHPLGTLENPVRAYLPSGQRAYVRRLVCPDGSRPYGRRLGAGDIGPYGNVTDIYEVVCEASLRVRVFMDMYHPNTIETTAIPGFEIRGF